MEVEAMEEGEINDEAGEEVEMEDMDYAELKNKFFEPKKRVVLPFLYGPCVGCHLLLCPIWCCR
jgi:hypothetical protein